MTLAAALVALAALAAPPKPARPAEKPRAAAALESSAAPVHVDADSVHYIFQRKEVVFTGNPVTLTREDARLTCARLVAKNDDAGQIATATCQGDVRLVRGERVITCDSATYENAEARVTCLGNTVLRDRGAEARGARLVYELATDEVKLEGGDQGPVQITVPGAEVEARKGDLAKKRQEPPR